MAPAFAHDVVIGVTNPVTGRPSESHVYVKGAIDLAVEEINAEGGILVGGERHKLRIQLEDDACRPAVGVSAVRRLISKYKVPVILGSYCSSVTLAEMRVTQQNQVPQITSISVNPKITASGNKWMFRNKETSTMRANALVGHVIESLKIKTIGMIAVNDDYGRGSVKKFSAKFEENGVDVLAKEYYLAESEDFVAQLTAIKAKNPEALYLVSRAIPTCIQLIKQARQLGYKTLIASTGCAQDEVARGGEAVNGVWVVTAFEANQKDPMVQEFVKKFRAKVGRNPNFLSAPTYDAIYVIARAMERANTTTDRAKIRDAIAETRMKGVYSYPGHMLYFDENGQAPVRPGLARFEKGQRTIIYQ
ncbi:MAG: ABC transporter substrate-binding protein [Candidatus Methylomirabilia bacterium]